jgi:adenosine kinase
VQETSPIIVSGSIAIDRIMSFSGKYKDSIQPDKLDSISVSILIDELVDAYGGVGANITYSLALLGHEPILLGSIGKDGLAYMEKLAHHGVNIAHVFESDLPTASFTVMTDSDQNQIGGFYSGAMSDSDALSFEPWKDKNPIVVVSPHDPKAMRRQVAETTKWGLRLCYDIGQQVSNLPAEEMREGVEAAELLILNDYELAALSKKTGIATADIKKRVPILVTTLGKNGSAIEGSSVPEPIHVDVVKPQRVADPTGAGDAYRSGFLYGLARNWPLKACAQLGAVCATYAIEAMGTQSHHFTVDEITARYEDTFNEPLPSKLRKD